MASQKPFGFPRLATWKCKAFAPIVSIVLLQSSLGALDDRREGVVEQPLEKVLEHNHNAKWPHKSHIQAVQHNRATETEIHELLSQVAKELSPWDSGISLDMVEKLYCLEASSGTVRIQIIAGRPYQVGQSPNHYQSRFWTLQKQILDLCADLELPDVDFHLSQDDRCPEWLQSSWASVAEPTLHCEKPAPLFVFSKSMADKGCVNIPDSTFGGWSEAFLPDWSAARKWMQIAASRIPFHIRQDSLFWRGAFTNWQRSIVAKSEKVQNSSLIDVKLMVWEDDPQVFAENFISLPDHCRHKHLLHMSGNAYSARLKYLMLCGSAIIFPYSQETSYFAFWYHMLKANENIVITEEINEENKGENVLNAVAHLVNQEQQAEIIGKKGQYLASEILHPENIQRYWHELLVQYSKLQSFVPTLHPDAVPLEIALMRPDRTLSREQKTCNVCEA